MEVATKEQRIALMEGNVFSLLQGKDDGRVYSRSGPGPIATHPTMNQLVDRGWFTAVDGLIWEITPAGRTAATDLAAGRMRSL